VHHNGWFVMLVMLRPERLADIAVERVVLGVDTHLPPADWTTVYWTEISGVFWDIFKIHDTHLPTRTHCTEFISPAYRGPWIGGCR
jgi:hypothetical protein